MSDLDRLWLALIADELRRIRQRIDARDQDWQKLAQAK